MALDAKKALAIAKKYTEDTVIGMGAIKGDKGDRGDNGKSAYEVAVAAGYSGTEEEWLASLEGEKGDKGDTGAKGEDGAQGQDGARGDKGDDGYSPIITVTDITGGHRVTVTDATGSQSFDVMDGKDGSGGDAKVFVAEYNVTTAQEINAFLDSADPKAPMVVKRGADYYTVITTSKQADNKVIIRTFATLSGVYYIFQYTVTNGTWANGNYGLQQVLQSGTNIKTVNGESLLGSGNIEIQGGGVPRYIVDKPEGSSPVSGNVVQVGTFVNTDGTEYGIYEFYYKTSTLPAADATKTYSFSPLLDDYTIFEFIDQSGITSNGHVISSGRTDGTSRIIIQQFSKNNKNVMLRAYGDYSTNTALLRIKFIGTKNA